jgi:hypothetical protein
MRRVVTLHYDDMIRDLATQLHGVMERARAIWKAHGIKGTDPDWRTYCLEMAPSAVSARTSILSLANLFETDTETVIRDIAAYVEPLEDLYNVRKPRH